MDFVLITKFKMERGDHQYKYLLIEYNYLEVATRKSR